MASTGTRRRGAALEDAILAAAWDELDEVGYADLTMEGVAARASTSKAVLYRRWPNRAQLMIAAMRQRVTPLSADLPRTGELRGDLLALLRRAAGRYREFDPDLLHGLLAELPNVQSEIVETNPETVLTILRDAADRGEIDLAGVTPRIARLPLDLLRHEIAATHAVVPDPVLTEIVDDIVLPLLAARSNPPASTQDRGGSSAG
jgi:AcrR family transcriptional regulator